MSDEFEQYQTQLRSVERALLCSSDPVEKKSLESLRDDLTELLELTKETVSTRNKTENAKDDNFQDEMALFMKEVVEAGDSSLLDTSLKTEMESKVGEKCSAPHCHSWGNIIYHNAIICGVDEALEGSSVNVRARVLFTNPTHKEMIPCSYYFEGECKFESDKCHFSHGESVAFEDLKEYKEPQFEKLSRNCVVLAKMKDRMWYKGRVLCSNFVEKICRVRLESTKKEMDFNFEDLFPIFHDDELSSGSSDESDIGVQSDIEYSKKTNVIETNLFSYAKNQSLGQWEKHTKGIGSKLMSKMGYIAGTGLGWNGEGIVTPISVQIMPPGRSLDYCMELREAANGDRDLFNVEKKLEQQQKRQEILNTKAYTRECKKTDVFSFLNGTLLATQPAANHLKAPTFSSSKNIYHNQSTKKLNVESVRIADDIRRKERELSKIKESISRHHEDSDVHNRLKVQLEAKKQELAGLKKCESSLAKEQMSRKTKDKLSVF